MPLASMLPSRTLLRRLAAGLALLAVAGQFVRPAKNRSAAPHGADSFVSVLRPPAEVRDYLERSCYDCHSENTRYPWYTEIQPIGWVLANQVRKGKRSLNFSDFGTLGKSARAKRMEYMVDAINEHAMPQWFYRFLHDDATHEAETVQFLTKSIADLAAK